MDEQYEDIMLRVKKRLISPECCAALEEVRVTAVGTARSILAVASIERNCKQQASVVSI